MLNKLNILAVGAALAQLTSAVGNARVTNKCPFSVTAWSVGSTISDPHTLSTGSTYSEVFTRDPKTGGRAIKVTLDPDGLYTGKPQTIYAYNLDGSTIWYDLSDVFGDAFAGHKVKLASANKDCPSIVWSNGTPPAGSQVKNCGAAWDVTLTLCA
ncbi:bys1 family protein [Purpureocillium lavendulum]|uniref:Bys1 family protein n=1 Tax=Purpureocillium lavendulum TaxID=1247861 RepID=A0AB34FI57_9HYPO|nr:bys1 family protein [Purpureocillium lavendulum]